MGDEEYAQLDYSPLPLRVTQELILPQALAPFATLGADERWLYDILLEAKGRADRLAAEYCYEFGSQLVTGRRYRAAWTMLEVALGIYLQYPAPPAERVDEILGALAKLLEAMLPAPDAVGYLERARLLWGVLRGPEHTELAAILHNLGYVRKRRGELAAARDCYRQALAIWQEVLEPGHPFLVIAYNNLGAVGTEAGRPASARRDFACVLDNLATTAQAMGDTTSALEAWTRAYRVQRRLLGPEHPCTVATSHNLQQALVNAERRQYSRIASSQAAATL